MFSKKQKKIFQLNFAAFVVSFVLVGQDAQAEDITKSKYTICKNGNVVRTIRVQLNGLSCKAIYTKEGSDQVVGKSGTPDICYDVANKIRENLVIGNWKCKDISETRVSSSTDQ